MIKYLLLICLLVGASQLGLATPTITDNSPNFNDWLGGKGRYSTPTLGLIDPSRLTVNHAVSFGFSSGGGNSLMKSLYAANFTYRLSNPLTLNFVLGMQNLQLNGIPGQGSQNAFLGGFSLDYRPRKNILFRFEMQNVPQGIWPYGGVYPNSYKYMFGDRFIHMIESKHIEDPQYDTLNGPIRP